MFACGQPKPRKPPRGPQHISRPTHVAKGAPLPDQVPRMMWARPLPTPPTRRPSRKTQRHWPDGPLPRWQEGDDSHSYSILSLKSEGTQGSDGYLTPSPSPIPGQAFNYEPFRDRAVRAPIFGPHTGSFLSSEGSSEDYPDDSQEQVPLWPPRDGSDIPIYINVPAMRPASYLALMEEPLYENVGSLNDQMARLGRELQLSMREEARPELRPRRGRKVGRKNFGYVNVPELDSEEEEFTVSYC